MSSTTATGVNISKTGVDPPLKNDEELPEWLWNLSKPEKTLSELRKIARIETEAEMDMADVSSMRCSTMSTG